MYYKASIAINSLILNNEVNTEVAIEDAGFFISRGESNIFSTPTIMT